MAQNSQSPQLPKGLTQEAYNALKEEHGQLVHIKVSHEDGRTLVMIGKPKLSNKAFGQAFQASLNDFCKASAIMVNDLWLAGDKEIKDEMPCLTAAGMQLAKLLNQAEAELVFL